MNLIVLLIQILVVLFTFKIHKSILKPPVFLSIIWLIPISVLSFVELLEHNSYSFNGYALIFPFGCFLFSIMYLLVDNDKKIIEKEKVVGKKTTFLLHIFIIIEFLLVIYWILDVTKYVNANFKYNFWYTYKWGVSQGDYLEPFFIPYLRTATRVLTCVMFVNYLRYKNKLDNIWFLFQIIITFIINFIGQGRGGIFALFVPLCIIYLLLNNDSKMKKIIAVIVTLVSLLIVFFVYGSMKDPYTINADKSPLLSFENYLCGGIVSFCNWAASSHEFAYGAYSFRFINALLSGIGFDVKVVSMVEEYVENIHGNIGNVYTFYKWYANDFGVIYALAIQGLLGIIYGFISKKTRTKPSTFIVVLYALMFYPLFMQFFNDQYFSNLSIWIQYVFWLFIFCKTKIFMVNSKK